MIIIMILCYYYFLVSLETFRKFAKFDSGMFPFVPIKYFFLLGNST